MKKGSTFSIRKDMLKYKARKSIRQGRRNLKWRLFLKQRGKCCFCGCQMRLNIGNYRQPEIDAATIEHIDPFLISRNNHPSNKTLSCMRCNNARKIVPFSQFAIMVKTLTWKEIKAIADSYDCDKFIPRNVHVTPFTWKWWEKAVRMSA